MIAFSPCGAVDATARQWLRKLQPIPGYTVEDLLQDIKDDSLILVNVVDRWREKRIAVAALRFTDAVEIWALAGAIGGCDGLAGFLRNAEHVATANGLRLVRFQTARPGLMRWVRRCGYSECGREGIVVRFEKCLA